MSAEPHLLFVYGTLRRGGSHESLLAPCARYLGAATLPGRLYQLPGGYPGLIHASSEPTSVSGDLWELAGDGQALLDRLDDYEEASERFPAPREYARMALDVTHQGRERTAWVYLYRWSLTDAALIEGGDYLAFAGEGEA